MLSSLPEAWDGLVMVVSNSYGTRILKFDDAVVFFSVKKRAESHRVRRKHQEVP